MRNVIRIVVILIVALYLFISTRPTDYHVERSSTLAASPAAVYGLINDFHGWSQWSPWDKLDPAMKKTYEGPTAGTGAMYHWASDGKAGAGSMRITGSKPDQGVGIDLEFEKPFKSSCVTTFVLTPVGDSTKVTWSMDGKRDLMGKAMSLVMNMDKMVGPDFERGLASLGTAAAAVKPAAADSAAASVPPASAPTKPAGR